MSGAPEMCGEQTATYVACFPDGSLPIPTAYDAYVHVRVTKPVRPTGSVTVYLPNGTALLVPARFLVRLARARCEPTPADGTRTESRKVRR
jgi:hypothetical protein